MTAAQAIAQCAPLPIRTMQWVAYCNQNTMGGGFTSELPPRDGCHSHSPSSSPSPQSSRGEHSLPGRDGNPAAAQASPLFAALQHSAVVGTHAHEVEAGDASVRPQHETRVAQDAEVRTGPPAESRARRDVTALGIPEPPAPQTEGLFGCPAEMFRAAWGHACTTFTAFTAFTAFTSLPLNHLVPPHHPFPHTAAPRGALARRAHAGHLF